MVKKHHNKHRHKSQGHKPHRPTDRLKQPLFPGGITTRGDFIKQRKAATNLEFAPQEQEIAQEEKAIPGWYQDYLRKLQGLQTQTTEQYKGLQSQAGSLAETVADATPEGQKAAESRNNIVKAIQGALLQQQGAAGNRLTEMGAIAGQRKDQRLGDVATAKTGLAKAKGDFATKFTAEGKQREFENALAAKQFGLKVEDAKTERIKANKPTETTYEKEFSKQSAKYGFSPHDWALLGPRGRARRIAEEQKRKGVKPKSISRIEKEEQVKQAARHGYSRDDWLALPPGKRSAIIRGKSKDKKDKEKGTEFSWRTPGQRGTGSSQASQAKTIASQLRKGDLIPGAKKEDKPRNPKGRKLDRHQAAKFILNDSGAPEPVLVSAALDAAYDGHLSRETARRLQSAGFKAREIAKSLGIPTYTEWARNAYRSGAGRSPH